MKPVAAAAPAAALHTLSAFQVEFAGALFRHPYDAAGTTPQWARQPAFAVYRNTVMKGCIDALQATHPAVLHLVGEAWFRSAAACYVRTAPPSEPRLLNYGIPGGSVPGFADFLSGFAPAAEWPYLPGVALLDGCWSASHAAADAACADAGTLAHLDPAALGTLRLRPHPAARWHWFDGMPVATIWSASRAGTEPADGLRWQGEGALLTRPADHVRWSPIDRAGCALLDACSRGLMLGEAAQAALACDAGCDLSALLALLLRQGALLSPTEGAFP